MAQTDDSRVRRWPARRVVLWCAAGVVILGVLLGGWAAVEASRVRAALAATSDDLMRIQHEATSGHVDAARALLPLAHRDAVAAESAAHSTPLRVVRALPLLHDDVGAVATMSTVVRDLTDEALPPMLDAVEHVDPAKLLDANGHVDVAAIAGIAPSVQAADARVAAAQRTVAGLTAAHVHAPVRHAVGRLDDALDSVRAQTGTAARAAALLPPMLGADGPRHYLVMVQNNAEFRSTGGIPGSVLLVQADHGAVSIQDQRPAGSLGSPSGDPVVDLTADELTLFGTQPAIFGQDVNLIPDFPRSAELLAAMWQSATGVTPDGVLSVDPVVLAKVLGATGAVTLASGEKLTSQNAAQLLLHDVYLRTNDPQQQDAFFAATTRAVFDHLLGPATPKTGVVDALASAAREGRVMLWSARPQEQSRLSGTVLSGELVGRVGRSPVVGVYLDDGSGAKMSWFVDSTVGVRREGDELVATLTLTNTAPAGGAGLPSYMTGTTLPAGDVRTNFDVYAPTGGAIRAVTVDGARTDVFRARYRGLDLAEWAAQLSPGQTVTVKVRMSAPASLPGEPRTRVTPAARGQHIAVTSEISHS